jgi:GNAT superfamily N-acetyltransferase
LSRSTLWAADLADEGPPPSRPPGFVEVTAASRDALVVAMGDEGDRVAMRLARGSRAFAVNEGGMVVAYGWLSKGREWLGELAIEFAPSAGEAYVWNCFTLEAHRRRGHYRAVLEGIVAVARAEGVRRLWIGSVDVPAEKADRDAGFVRALRFGVLHLGPWRRLTLAPAEGADPGLVDDARQRIGVRGWSHVGRARTRIH